MKNSTITDKSWRLVCLINSYGIPESDRELIAARELLRNFAILRGLECVWEEKIQVSSRIPELNALSDLYTRTDIVHLRPLPHSKASEKSIRYVLRLVFRDACCPGPLDFGVVLHEFLDRFPVNGKVLVS